MVQDISNLRNKLLHMLDTNLSMDTTAALLQQQEEWAAKLAVERQATDQLRNEVEAGQRDLSECQMKLQTSLDSNERIASELDALRMELESSRDECSMHKRELEAMQLKKPLEVNSWEIMQAQHQQFVCESKTQLEKREEKVAQERINQTQIELQLQEAMQESANLQTELQWTRDSLEEAEAMVETFQRIEPVLEIGDPESAYEFFMVGQLQAEIIDMNARLEEERRHRRELDNQMKANNSTLHESPRETNNDHEQEIKPFKEKRKIRHQDAILQLQLELDAVDGGASLQPINNTQIQLDMEKMENALAEKRQLLREARATIDHLRQQLEKLTPAKLMTEKSVLNSTTDSVQCSKLLVFSLDTENVDLQDQFQETQADSNALKSTIANLQRELEEKSAEIAALVAQLHMGDRHVFKLECQNMELRDAMRRQGVAVKALCEKFQKQESLQSQEERACRDNATQLQSRVELLQQELEKMQLLQNEKALIYEEHHSLRSSAAQKIEQLRSLVADLEKQRGQLQQEVKRKQSATETLERRFLVAQQQKLQCQEDLRICKKMTEKHKMRVQEKQVEVEILGKSVEELENTVLALESQVGLLKREGDRQSLVREDMESELRVLKLQNTVMDATLPEASGTSGTSGGGLKRESNAESSGSSRKERLRSWSNIKWDQMKMIPFPRLRISRRKRKMHRD